MRAHVSTLCKVLGLNENGGRYVENVSGQGHRLVVPVRSRNRACLSVGTPADIDGLYQRLEGNPLAIEIAAVWVDVLGLQGLAATLDQGLHLNAAQCSDWEKRGRQALGGWQPPASMAEAL